jgi:hypothetical protein
MPLRCSGRSLVAVPLLLAVVTGCGTAAKPGTHSHTAAATPSTSAASPAAVQPSASPTPAQSSSVHPGHRTPQDVVDGFLRGELAGKWNKACSYVLPNIQSNCLNAAASLSGHPKGRFAIGHVAISGVWAVVAITGHVCAPIAGCQSNSDPSAGLPTGSESIAQAAAKGSSAFSPVFCERQGSKWYVYLKA